MRRTERKPLSKTMRFEVFKRDSFACQYCGAKAPDVLLQVDHIKPVARGGDNSILNLVTSCAACNGGKGARELSEHSAVERQRTQASALQERREQIEMMMQWHQGLLSIDDAIVSGITQIYSKLCPGWTLNPSGHQMVLALVQKYGSTDVIEALKTAASLHVKVADGRATEESMRVLVDAWKKHCSYIKWNRENPIEGQLRYIRGILRKRLSYCPEDAVLARLREASDAGVSLSELRSIAIESTRIAQWESAVEDAVERVNR